MNLTITTLADVDPELELHAYCKACHRMERCGWSAYDPLQSFGTQTCPGLLWNTERTMNWNCG